MKTLKLICITFLLSSNFIIGQSDIKFKEKFDSLNLIIKDIDSQMNILNEKKLKANGEISQLNQLKNKLELEENLNKGIKIAVNSFGGNLRSTPSVEDNLLIKIPKGDTIQIYNWYKEPFFKASYKGFIGYISSISIDNSPIAQQIMQSQIKSDNPRYARLIKLYGTTNAQGIMAGKYWIGMSDSMATESLGSPEKINRSTGSWGVHEQWVYSNGSLYLYFQNGILTSTQD